MISLIMPAIAMSNRAVAVPCAASALTATDFYQVLKISDVSGGVVNLITGERDALAKTISEHDDISAVWYFGDKEASARVERPNK